MVYRLEKTACLDLNSNSQGQRLNDGLQVCKDACSTHFTVPEGHESHQESPGDGSPACHICPCLWGLGVKTAPLVPSRDTQQRARQTPAESRGPQEGRKVSSVPGEITPEFSPQRDTQETTNKQ